VNNYLKTVLKEMGMVYVEELSGGTDENHSKFRIACVLAETIHFHLQNTSDKPYCLSQFAQKYTEQGRER
jgi:hypothetical protein